MAVTEKNERKNILDALNRLISVAAKDGKTVVASSLYTIQQDKKYEQNIKLLNPLIKMIIEAGSIQKCLDDGSDGKVEDVPKTAKDALRHGSVISLVTYGRLLQVSTTAPYIAANSKIKADGHVFLVVGAGEGLVSFFCPSHHCFLALVYGNFVLSPVSEDIHDYPRYGESFEVQEVDGSNICLYCPSGKVWVSLDSTYSLRAGSSKNKHCNWEVLHLCE